MSVLRAFANSFIPTLDLCLREKLVGALVASLSQIRALHSMVDFTVKPYNEIVLSVHFFQIFNCIKMFILHNI